MKKIYSLCSILVVLALFVTIFTACGDKSEKEATTTTASTSAETGFTVEIEDSQAVVKKDGKEFQTLKYPLNTGKTFDKEYATKNNEFLDMNFDGLPDFYIAIGVENDAVNYYCWLYNATTEQFDYSASLSALKNISVDSENQVILSNLVIDGKEHVFSYKWVDGQLTFENDYSEENGGIPEEVTKAVSESSIGTDKTTSSNNKTETTNKNSSSNDKTTTKANKPANTTTTAPNKSGGIVVETGNANSNGWY
ncbi:MAG: XAC2610-related protein [Acutalibacteraceae bacterium]